MQILCNAKSSRSIKTAKINFTVVTEKIVKLISVTKIVMNNYVHSSIDIEPGANEIIRDVQLLPKAEGCEVNGNDFDKFGILAITTKNSALVYITKPIVKIIRQTQ
jgi:hypothetical protein